MGCLHGNTNLLANLVLSQDFSWILFSLTIEDKAVSISYIYKMKSSRILDATKKDSKSKVKGLANSNLKSRV